MRSLFNFIHKRLPENRLGKGLALLAGGNILSQLLAVMVSPILTRLFSPSDFGILAAYISITSILAVALTLKYEQAIALPESDIDALPLVKLSLLIVLANTLVSFLLVLLLRERIASILNITQFNTYLFLLPISVLLIGSFNVFRQWNIRFSRFALIGKVRLTQVLASVTVQILGSFAGLHALFAGQLINQGFGSYRLGKSVLKSGEFRSITLTQLRNTAVRFKRFPIYTLWAALLNRSSLQFPVFVLTALFDPAIAGLYALANRVVKAPADVLNSSLNSLFLSEAAIAKNKGTLKELTLKTHKNLSIAALPSLLFFAYISPDLFSIVFGENWEKAGHFARWITISVYFNITVVPLTMIFSVLEKQNHELIFQISLFIFRALAIGIALNLSSEFSVVALFVMLSGVCYIGFLFWAGKQLGNNIFSLIPNIAISASHALLIFIPLIVFSIVPDLSEYYFHVLLLTAFLTTAHLALFIRSIYK